MIDYKYQVGGSLTVNAPSYVRRQADYLLYEALKQGKFCYILNSRQMGNPLCLQVQNIACNKKDLNAVALICRLLVLPISLHSSGTRV
ncbi:MAG: hypothetical protein V7K46_32475 [Nostoc sp.]